MHSILFTSKKSTGPKGHHCHKEHQEQQLEPKKQHPQATDAHLKAVQAHLELHGNAFSNPDTGKLTQYKELPQCIAKRRTLHEIGLLA